MLLPVQIEEQLVDLVAETFWDPVLWALTMYPWGERGTFLESWPEGPDAWQMDFLIQLRKSLIACRDKKPRVAGGLVTNTVRMAVSSGHGVGKTAIMAIVLQWWMATRPHPQAVVTAGTKTQLGTKTWRELKKWQDVCMVGHWFDHTATQFKLKADPDTWFATAIPWSEHNPQAFAGTHERYVAYMFDEATTITSGIWETSEGAFTTEGPHLWLVFSNPEDATGRFRECWTTHRDRWITFEVDARNSRLTNKELIAEWLATYGEDSDFFRVRVRGMFPRTGPQQFITNDEVETAVARFQRKEIKPEFIPRAIPRLMGVDPAGGDSTHSAETVIVLRQGPYLLPEIIRFREKDGMKTAALIAHQINLWRPDVVFMDTHGLGKPIYDRLVQLNYTNVVACYAGEFDGVLDRRVYYNNRIQWWARMKEWLPTAAIPDDSQLKTDLLSPRREYNIKMQMLLESKDDMKLRGIPSPDTGDAVALTFAQPVPMRDGDTDSNVEPDVV